MKIPALPGLGWDCGGKGTIIEPPGIRYTEADNI